MVANMVAIDVDFSQASITLTRSKGETRSASFPGGRKLDVLDLATILPANRGPAPADWWIVQPGRTTRRWNSQIQVPTTLHFTPADTDPATWSEYLQWTYDSEKWQNKHAYRADGTEDRLGGVVDSQPAELLIHELEYLASRGAEEGYTARGPYLIRAAVSITENVTVEARIECSFTRPPLWQPQWT